jgi:hypothetical protein
MVQKFYLFVEYGLFNGFFMNKFACRKKMPIDIFLIFCHDILAMILFRILTKSKGVHVLVFQLQNKNRDKPRHRQWGSPIPFPTDGACVLSVIRFQDGGR